MKRLLIWGAGDQGLVTYQCALETNQYDQIDFMEIKEKDSRLIENKKIYKEEEFEEVVKRYDEVIVATGSNVLRQQKIEKLNTFNIPLATIIHPSAIICSNVKISGGTTILANVIININAAIGAGCIINNGSIIEHDCFVGNYVNICPRFAMAGHTSIGNSSYMGIGSTVIDDIKIGNNVTVGAGVVVICDIPDDKLVVGIPAKIIKDISSNQV